MSPPKCIALITDFGQQDHYVASMKAAIYKINPTLNIIDITHDVPPQNVQRAAFQLAMSFLDFPLGTVFIAVVDPGVGTSRKPMVLQIPDYTFVGPDNGIFSYIIGLHQETYAAYEINPSVLNCPVISATFHGRDIFAPIGALIASAQPPKSWQLNPLTPVIANFPTCKINEEGRLAGWVMMPDRFGNLITTIHIQQIECYLKERPYDTRLDQMQIQVVGKTLPLLATYQNPIQPPLHGLINASGYLEIVCHQSSAADRFPHLLNTLVYLIPPPKPSTP